MPLLSAVGARHADSSSVALARPSGNPRRLGLMDRLQEHFARDTKPSRRDVTNAFWNACHGGQLEPARYLLAQGADLNWVGHNQLTPWMRLSAKDIRKSLRGCAPRVQHHTKSPGRNRRNVAQRLPTRASGACPWDSGRETGISETGLV